MKKNSKPPLAIALFLVMLVGATLPSSRQVRSQTDSSASVDAALTHLAEQMDQWHKAFNVYTNAGDAGNHFVAQAKIASDPDAVDMDSCSQENPHAGLTAIKCTFRNTTGQNWGGWYFLNGVLTGAEQQPRLNFGETPNAGVDLNGATQLTFWARGAQGKEQVEFFMGGVGRDPVSGDKMTPFPDSTRRIPELGTLFTLTTDWTKYSINLPGDLSYVLGGFAWTCNASSNPQGATFWIDDIQYNKSRLDEPRFIQSYVTLATQKFDTVHRNAAFTYDNAIAMLAFMARGTADDWRRAALIAEALVYAQTHDRFYSDGRLRNAYQAGDLKLPPGWTPNGKSDTVRMPAIVDCAKGQTTEDRLQVSSYTRNVAWAMITLLTYYQQRGGAPYLDAATRMAEWIEQRREDRGLGGYRAGFEGADTPSAQAPNDPVELSRASSEDALAVFVAFTKLLEVTGDAKYGERIAHARAYMDQTWSLTIGCFRVGTKDASTLDLSLLVLAPQPLSLLALPDGLNKYSASNLPCSELRYRTNRDGFVGFDANDDRDGVWFEGTAYMAVAYKRAGQGEQAAAMLAQLQQAQARAQNANGQGLVAASHDGVTTGFLTSNMESQLLYSRLHIGTTAWYVCAALAKNPYDLFASTDPKVMGITIKGKKLFACGARFDSGAKILLNGETQKTANDQASPTTKLVAKKAGRKVKDGDKVKVRNADGTESNEVTVPATPCPDAAP